MMDDTIEREHEIEELLELLRIVWQEYNAELTFEELVLRYHLTDLSDEEIVEKLEDIIESMA